MVERANKAIKQIFDAEKYDPDHHQDATFYSPRVDITDKGDQGAGTRRPASRLPRLDEQGRAGRDRRRARRRVDRRSRSAHHLHRAASSATPETTSSRQRCYRSQLASTRAGCVIVGPDMRDARARARPACARPLSALCPADPWWAARTRCAGAGIHPCGRRPNGQGRSERQRRRARRRRGRCRSRRQLRDRRPVLRRRRRAHRRGHPAGGARHVPGTAAASANAASSTAGGDRRDGFGFAPHRGEWVKIEHQHVRIGNDAEIGANTCIDRGALDDTVIEDGVKLDNLVQVGHNTRIGAHSAAAGCVGISGSTTIGKRVTLGGAVGGPGHVTIADDVHVTAFTPVSRSLHQPGVQRHVRSTTMRRGRRTRPRCASSTACATGCRALEKKTS